MRRKVFDVLASWIGVVAVVGLLVAGGLAMWGYSFASSNVHNQLAEQQISFPSSAEINAVKVEYAKGGQKAVTDPEFPNAKLMVPALAPYAGKQVLTGQEAAVYANDFIGQHLYAMPLHGVYSQVSTAARAAKPGSATATQMTALEGVVFQGTTLRGLLLEAYGYSVFGLIAMWAGIMAFVLAAVMALLTALGFWHASRTPDEEEIVVHDHGQPKEAAPNMVTAN